MLRNSELRRKAIFPIGLETSLDSYRGKLHDSEMSNEII